MTGSGEVVVLKQLRGAGVLTCQRCSFSAEVVGLVSGFAPRAWAVVSFQCQQCGKLVRVGERELGEAQAWEVLDRPCDCGGRLVRDRPLCCPSCRATELDYARADPPLFFKILGGDGTLSCAHCGFSKDVIVEGETPHEPCEMQCQSCGGLQVVPDPEGSLCGCGGSLARDRVLFCPRCSSITQLRYHRYRRLTFRNVGGAGTIECLDCGFSEQITGFVHGPCSGPDRRCVAGVQCQACGAFGTVSDPDRPGVCSCGGERSRDRTLFCPLCRGKSLKYKTAFMT